MFFNACHWFCIGCSMFFNGFHRVFIGFSMFCNVFQWFSFGFHWFFNVLQLHVFPREYIWTHGSLFFSASPSLVALQAQKTHRNHAFRANPKAFSAPAEPLALAASVGEPL